MIGIPLKKTDKVDFVDPLESFIKNSFGEDVLKGHREAVQELQQLREDLRLTQDKSDNTSKLYLKYLSNLASIALRFPVSESNLRLSFTWYEAFKNSKKQSRFSIHFEKANVLFNLAAHYSQIGSQNRGTEEGVKRAANYFQLAAGCLSQIKDILQQYPAEAALVDLTTDSLNALSNLMLAQAQECFFEKALKGNMQPTILTKLAAQTAEYYDTVYSLFNLPSLKPNIDKTWPVLTQVRGQYFNSIAHYQFALALHKADQYGKEVAYLQKAVFYVNEAKKQLKQLGQDMQEAINKLSAVVLKAQQTAEFDNSRIYHEQVPRDVPAIEKKSLVKPILPEEIPLTEDSDPFFKLVPFAMLQSISIYGEMKASLVRTEISRIEEANGIARSSLSSMGLPGSLQAFESPTGIPQSLLDKVHILQSRGGIGKLYDLLENLAGLGRENESILNAAIDTLNSEESEDNTLRQTYGDKWNRTPSHTLTGNLRQEALKYQGNLEHARKSDQYIKKKLTDNEQLITLLSGTHDDIVAFIPANAESGAVNLDVVAQLKSGLRQLDDLISGRDNLQSDLKKTSEKDDITAKLFGTTEAPESIFARELLKYQHLQARVSAQLAEQEKILERISAANDLFLQARQSNKVSLEREAALQKLDLAFKTFMELEGNFKEGVQFYKNFQDLLVRFKVQVDDFVFARTTEKNELQAQIQSESQKAQIQAQAQAHQAQAQLLGLQQQQAAAAPQLFPQVLGAPPTMVMGPGNQQFIIADPNNPGGFPGALPMGWQMAPQAGASPYYIIAQPPPSGSSTSTNPSAPPPYPGVRFQ